MLRLRIDLTAFGAKPGRIFWRLEPDGILHKNVHSYASQILQEYGITGVKAVTYLDGTFLPQTESPMILRDGDLLRILPGKKLKPNAVPTFEEEPEMFDTTAYNGAATIGDPAQPHENGGETAPSRQETGTMECANAESTEDFNTLTATDVSENNEHNPKKRKRGKRQSRIRSKRVSFDVLAEENGGGDGAPQLESTPFRKRGPGDTTVETTNVSSVGTRSEAYMTALDITPGLSKQSRTPMKHARKLKKLQSGVGYFLNILGSEDSSVVAAISETSETANENNQLTPGPSSCGDSLSCTDGSQNASDKNKKDGSLLSMLPPNVRISCDIGMFDAKTSGVEHYPDVTLEILNNNAEKKMFTVRHIEGNLPSHVSGSDFKVDWGMLSSVNIL